MIVRFWRTYQSSREDLKRSTHWGSDQPEGDGQLTELLELLNKLIPEDSFYFRNPGGNLRRHFIENHILHCLVDSLLPGVGGLRLESKKEVTLGKQLIERLSNLNSLTIGKGIALDEEFFKCALKACRRIEWLTIESSCLRQQQLDQMPNSLPNLQILTLTGDFSVGHFNLHFLAKFKNLHSIRLDFNTSRRKRWAISSKREHTCRISIYNFVACRVFGFTGSDSRSSLAARPMTVGTNQTRSSSSVASKRRSSITTGTTRFLGW